ncbi:MAG: DUF4240 domain-containing protein [Moraxella sp.]|nr:DUF4240 domain-containing protein [Moraxella sp.]
MSLKQAKSLITEDRFWSLIEQGQGEVDVLKAVLEKLSDDEIFGYAYWWSYFNAMSYKSDLWAVAYIVMGGCSDDCFDYFRFWLVAQGEQVFKNAMQNADSLCDIFDDIEDGDIPAQEDIDYVAMEVIDERHGDDMYYEMEAGYDDLIVPRPEIDFDWDEDDEESLRQICPNTFDKWWDNDRF